MFEKRHFGDCFLAERKSLFFVLVVSISNYASNYKRYKSRSKEKTHDKSCFETSIAGRLCLAHSARRPWREGGGPPRRNRPRPPLPTQHNSNRIRTPWALSSFRTATPVSTRRPFPPTLMTRGPTLPYPTPLHRKNPRKRIGGALIATCPFPPSFPSFLLSRRNAPP
jgi:hypothetical protein